MKDGVCHESLLAMPTLANDHLDAHSMSDLILQTLSDAGLNKDHILSQCHDGANVMSGMKGGVQAVIQGRLKRKIPYVHCFNHRLHLVIVECISSISLHAQYFDQCRLLYKFLKNCKVNPVYTGKQLSRLLEQRWCGHYETTKSIVNNFEHVLDVLVKVSSNTSGPSGE